MYNVPGRTACNILPATIETMAEAPRVVGVKEASGDISQVAELAGGSRTAWPSTAATTTRWCR